ncbi:hypothetical protein BST61_g5635 [Cercospora zeina]
MESNTSLVREPTPTITSDPQLPFQPIQDEPYDYFPNAEAEWRGISGACAIPHFFEVLKYLSRASKYVPLSRIMVPEALDERDIERAEGMAQAIFRQHEWPDLERYCKRCDSIEQAAGQKDHPDVALSSTDRGYPLR